jgi:transaldolase
VLYVEQLIRADVVNTMPEATLRAFADHGRADHVLPVAGRASAILRRAREAGIDLDAVTAELEREGVSSFCDSYHDLLDRIETKLAPTLDRADA